MPPPRRTSRRLYFILYQLSAEHAYSIAGYVPAEGEVIHVPPSPENEARLLFLSSYPVGYITEFDSDGPLHIHKPTGRHFPTPDHLQRYARHYDEQAPEHRGLGLYAPCPPELSPLRPPTVDPRREQVVQRMVLAARTIPIQDLSWTLLAQRMKPRCHRNTVFTLRKRYHITMDEILARR